MLADLSVSDNTKESLLRGLPESIPVVRNYSRRAAGAEKLFFNPPQNAGKAPWWKSLLPIWLRNELHSRSYWWPNPELLPLGHHAPDMPHALGAAESLLQSNPCQAVVVNADPWAGMLVGRRVAAKFGLPLILDLRDPWSVCELRRPMRPWPQRKLVDIMERWCVSGARVVILNTEKARDDYRAHYPHLPPERFQCIRNHADPQLLQLEPGERLRGEAFQALFFGNFRRFVDGHNVIDALRILKQRYGLSAQQFQLLVTGSLPHRSKKYAQKMGVLEYLADASYVPYTAAAPYLDSADLLLAFSNSSRQRVPAKVYDYLTTQRPIHVVADNPEIPAMLEGVAGVSFSSLTDVEGLADAMWQAYRRGPGVSVSRDARAFFSEAASAKLAGLLEHSIQSS